MMKAQSPTTRHFTLIELMVVVAIIAVILGLSVPLFRNSASGRAVDGAARMISTQLMLARNEAISRRKLVAVILPGEDFTYDTANDRASYKFTSFRSAFVTQENNTYKFERWVPNTQWTFLPTGAVTILVENREDLGTNAPTALKTSADPDTRTGYEPNGDFSIPNTNTITTVVDGSSNYMFDSSHTNTTGVRAVIFKPNGRCVQTNYVTVMEGVMEPGATEPSRENKRNIRVMEIKQFTGQIRFLF